MKKLLVFLFLILCLSSTVVLKNAKNPLFELQNVEKVCFVSAENYGDVLGVEAVACGNKFFNYCTLETAKAKLETFEKEMDGMQFYFSNINFEDIFEKLKMEIVDNEEIENMTIFYGYTPYYQNSVQIDGKKINVQIVLKNDEIVAGFPLILTGY